MSKFNKFHAPHDSCMKAIIIYDNFAFAAKANEMLQRAANQADAAMRWNIKPWRVDALNLHRSAEEAFRDALDAHLIVFAGHRAQALPSWLLNWLERWVVRRQITDAAFAVIGGRNGDALSMPSTPELSCFAGRHGLNFITDDEMVANDEEEFSEHSMPEQKVRPVLAQSRFKDVSGGVAYRGWGIND
jgi:hypothetical protein